jgi:hypothetical protein
VAIALGATAASLLLVLHDPAAAKPVGKHAATVIKETPKGFVFGIGTRSVQSDLLASAWTGVRAFEKTVSVRPDLVSYVESTPQRFPTELSRFAYGRGAKLLIEIHPTAAAVAHMADGGLHHYVASYAEAVKRFGHGVLIAFGPNMNVAGNAWGPSHVKPGVFRSAWRHFVKTFHQLHVKHVTWVFAVGTGRKASSHLHRWWPGHNYVSWLAVNGTLSTAEDTFATVFAKYVSALRSFSPKPLFLSGVAVARPAGQSAEIRSVFRAVTRYGMLGLVYSEADQTGPAGDKFHLGQKASGVLGRCVLGRC